MSNTFTYQKIIDTNKKSVIKLTGMFDGSGQEANTKRIQANTLFGALDANNNLLITGNTAKTYYELSLFKCWFDINTSGYIQLYWTGDTNTPLLNLSGCGEYNLNSGQPSIKNNNSSANTTGDIGITSVGMIANNSYTIILELHKNSSYYNYGQLTEPSVFNYGNYGVKP